mgnify:FL=1
MAIKIKTIIVISIVGLTIIAGIFFLIKNNNQPGKLDAFVLCLKDKSVMFYGAFWCPHCQTQKVMFGKSQKLLPYTECSTPDGNNQLSVCRDKKIDGYPTWEFSDGSRESGEVPLEKLSEKTGCPLP